MSRRRQGWASDDADMVDCQKHRQGLWCAGRITVIHVRVKVVEEGMRGVKHRRVWTREEGGRERRANRCRRKRGEKVSLGGKPGGVR